MVPAAAAIDTEGMHAARGYDERWGRWEAGCAAAWVVLSLGMWFRLLPAFPAGLLLIPLLWRTLADTGRGLRRRPGRLAVALLLTVLATMAATIVAQSLLDPLLTQLAGTGPVTSANTERLTATVRANPMPWVTLTCLLGPLGEELSYRYGVFRLVSRVNVPLAHLATALLFGLQHVVVAWLDGHPEQLLLLPGYALTSLVWTIAYRRTGNLAVSLGAHVLTNSMGVALMLTR